MSREFDIGAWWRERRKKTKLTKPPRPSPPKGSSNVVNKETEVNDPNYTYIKTLTFRIRWTDYKNTIDWITYTLLQHNKQSGRRKVQIAESGLAKDWGTKTTMYSGIVVPWLHGGNLNHLIKEFNEITEKEKNGN